MGICRSKCCPCFQGLAANKTARSGNLKPIKVTVAGAAGHIGYALLPMIAKGDMFGPDQRVIIYSLDINHPSVKENMKGIKDELDDGNFPLLVKAEWGMDDKVAFKDADYALLLGSYPRHSSTSEQEVLEKNILIFRTMGNTIKLQASKACKVLVSGPPASTNALICSNYAGPSLPKKNFFALSRLDHNRAVAQIKEKVSQKDKCDITSGDVKNLVIWGHCATNSDIPRCPDFDHCTIQGKPIRQSSVYKDEKSWLEGNGKDSLAEAVKQRGPDIVKLRGASSALSAARAIADTIRDIHCGTPHGEFSSVGVFTTGQDYGIKEGLVFSMPIRCLGNGDYEVVKGLNLSERIKTGIQDAVRQLDHEAKDAEQAMKKSSK